MKCYLCKADIQPTVAVSVVVDRATETVHRWCYQELLEFLSNEDDYDGYDYERFTYA
jgi:hypothetical protein|tara:strand:+ start:1462 stop:1632 length:171 start_codon:yes stop_codon:yes gene_type:complete